MSFVNLTATFFFNIEKATIVKKEFSSGIVLDTICNSIIGQYEYTFGEKPVDVVLQMLVDGFFLFNLHKNRYMLKSKEACLKYVEDSKISVEEKEYFLSIFLYNQRPHFLTFDEHEYLRAFGCLDGFNDSK